MRPPIIRFAPLIASSTGGPSGRVHMRTPPLLLDTPLTLRGPMGSSTEGCSGTVHMRPPAALRHLTRSDA
eukprot:8382338-Pyramimonas_sp.AAC.1